MDAVENDEAPMLTATDLPSNRHENNPHRRFSHRNRSVSISIPVSSSELNSGATSVVGFTGPLRSERRTPDIQRQGYPSQSIRGAIGFERREHVEQEHIRRHNHLWFHDVVYGGAKGWAGKMLSLLKQFTFGVKNPHDKVVQQWNQFIVFSFLLAFLIDPLFFYLLSVKKDYKCIVFNWPVAKTILIFRSMTDLIYLMHMLVQFRLAFITTKSRVVSAGQLVNHPKRIALHYLSGFFFLDLFIVLPLPQIIVLVVLPSAIASSGANYAKDLLLIAVLVQYIPRLYRFRPLLAGQSSSTFIFESKWANFVTNLLTFVLSGHIVGSFWYFFGLQRVKQCLQDTCLASRIMHCMRFIDCGHGVEFRSFEVDQTWNDWTRNENSSACFNEDGFPYGIYVKAVNLTTENSIITKYIYSFLWAFQQISTLAGNQTPSYFIGEIVFTMAMIVFGLLLFNLIIGNMQNYFQGLGRRQLEMSLRRRDVEQWMSHRHLPEDLRRKVQESERYNWATTRGVNEETLMENFPEDLQRDIRRHLFEFVKKVWIFALMDEPLLDAIFERLRQTTYIKGGRILYQGGLVTKMVFIVRGEMESMGEDGTKFSLKEGDVCGEELLTWCFEHSSVNGDTRNQRKPGYRLVSKRMVVCLTNVEAFVLHAADLEEVTSHFAGFLRNRCVQIAVRSLRRRHISSAPVSAFKSVLDSNNDNDIVNPTPTKENVRRTVWDSSTHINFLELCLDEVRKGNRRGSNLNRTGWTNLVNNFKECTGKCYTKLQLKNHWDAMKREWKLYDRLMRSESGLRWDPVTKTIDATLEWWNEKIQVDPELAKFKDTNLEMFQVFYDPLFLDCVAIEDRTKAPSQIESDNGPNDVHTETSAEDTEEKEDRDEVNCSYQEMLYYESGANKRKKTKNAAHANKGKASMASSFEVKLDTILQVLSNGNASFPPTNSIPSIQDCMAIVSIFPNFEPGSQFYNKALRVFWKKEARESFMIPPTNETKLEFLKLLLE